MANVYGKKVIDEATLSDEEEVEDHVDESEEVRDCKLTLNSFNRAQIEQGRGDKNGFHCDEDDSMNYEEITRFNQPVDFIFAVEDDDGVETEIGSHEVFTKESSVETTSPVSKDLAESLPVKSNQPIRSTRSAFKQQPNLQNGHSTPSSTPTITKSVERRKFKPSEPVDPPPTKQLRSSVRENRNVQNKPITQPTPNEPKTNSKKSINTPSNATPSIQLIPNEPKNTKKVINSSTLNSTSTPIGGPKNGKKSVNGIKDSTTTPATNRAASTHGKQNGELTNGTTKSNKKTLNSTDTPTPATSNQDPVKKRTRSYWTGKEHNRKLGPETPFVMIERLPMFLSGDTEYKGHDCLKTVCPAKRNRVKRKSLALPPRIQPLDSISDTINSVAKDVPLSPNMPPGRPKIGQNIRFQFWQTPLGNNVPVKSSYQKAKIIDYNQHYDLYEIELFHYDHPFVISMDRTKNQRITTNKMIIDWDSLADPSII